MSANKSYPCPHYGVCGGCTLQHLDDEDYKSYKRHLVLEALRHNGIHMDVQDPIIFPPHTRRRCNLKATRLKDKVLLGYHELKSHQIVDIQQCPLVVPEIETLFPVLRNCLVKVLNPKQKADVFLAMTDEGIDLILMIEGLRSLDFEQTQTLIDFAQEHHLARISYKYKSDASPVIALKNPTIRYGGVPVDIEADGFMQVTQLSDEVLTRYVLEALPEKTKRAVDLFCGRGTYTLPLSNLTKVDGFELDPTSLAALDRAKNRYQKPIRTFRRHLFDDPLSVKELESYDYAVINPPRAGALHQCRNLAQSSIPAITMVSCDPRTFARDAKMLLQGGYNLTAVTPVDQFLWSSHIEVVGKFVRNN